MLAAHRALVRRSPFLARGLAHADEIRSVAHPIAELGLVRSFRGHSQLVTDVAFHPRGHLAASTSWDGTVRLLQVRTGESRTINVDRLGPKGAPQPAMCVDFTPDGHYLIAGLGGGGLMVCDVACVDYGAPPAPSYLEGHQGKYANSVHSIACSTDGRTVVSGAWFGPLLIHELATGNVVGILHLGPDEDSILKQEVEAVAYSPDGRYLVASGGLHSILVFDLITGTEVRRFGHPRGVTGLAFSPDGRFLLCGTGNYTCFPKDKGGITILDWATGELVWSYEEVDGAACGVAYSGDGQTVLSSMIRFDRNSAWMCATCLHRVQLWNAKTGRLIGQANVEEQPGAVACSPDRRHVLSADEFAVHLWVFS